MTRGMDFSEDRPLSRSDFIEAWVSGKLAEQDVVDLILERQTFGSGENRCLQWALSSGEPALVRIAREAVQRVYEVELRRDSDEPGEFTEWLLSRSPQYLVAPRGAALAVAIIRALGTLPELLPDEAIARHESGAGSSAANRALLLQSLLRRAVPLEDEEPAILLAEGLDRKALWFLGLTSLGYVPAVARAISDPTMEAVLYYVHVLLEPSQGLSVELRRAVARWSTSDDPGSGVSRWDAGWLLEIQALGGQVLLEEWYQVLGSMSQVNSLSDGIRRPIGALIGKEPLDAILQSATKKRSQDAIRCLGLVPLPKSDGARAEQVRKVAKALLEIEATGHKVGGERRGNEQRAITNAFDLLARQLGRDDGYQVRLDYEVEALGVVEKESIVCIDDIVLAISGASDGEPGVVASKSGKILKSIPPRVKATESYRRLKDSLEKVKRSRRSLRLLLERAMVEGFPVAMGLMGLLKVSYLRPLVIGTIFRARTREETACCRINDGEFWELRRNRALDKRQILELLVAHPCDMESEGVLAGFVRDIGGEPGCEPFPQVTRSLHKSAPGERHTHVLSSRWRGCRIPVRQVAGMLAARGWRSGGESATMRRHFKRELVVADATFDGSIWDSSLDAIRLTSLEFRTPDGRPMPIALIPERIFSEVVRDLTLLEELGTEGRGQQP